MRATYDFLVKAFPSNAAPLDERSFVQAVVALASQLVAGGSSAGHEDEFGRFVAGFHAGLQRQRRARATAILDEDWAEYLQAMRASLTTAPRKRHDILVRNMCKVAPDLAKLLAMGDGTRSWVPGMAEEERREYLVPPSTMVMTSTDLKVENIYRHRDRYIYADWQRTEVWGVGKKQKLIDTILRGWQMPKLYVALIAEEPGCFYVVDGQQRLTAIHDFIDNKFSLPRKTIQELGLRGGYFKDLSTEHQDAITDHELQIDEIKGATLEEIKDLFLRLQQGMNLLGQEKLNAVYGGLRDYAASLAGHPFFQSHVTAADKRHSYFDIAAKVAAIEINGIDTVLRFKGLKQLYGDHANFTTDSPVAKRIDQALDFLARAFSETRLETRFRPIIQSMITVAARIVETGRAAGHEAEFAQFANLFCHEFMEQKKLGFRMTDRDYYDFSFTINGDLLKGAQRRHEIILRKLGVLSPALADILDPTSPIAKLPDTAVRGAEQSFGAAADATARTAIPAAPVTSVASVAPVTRVTPATSVANLSPELDESGLDKALWEDFECLVPTVTQIFKSEKGVESLSGVLRFLDQLWSNKAGMEAAIRNAVTEGIYDYNNAKLKPLFIAIAYALNPNVDSDTFYPEHETARRQVLDNIRQSHEDFVNLVAESYMDIAGGSVKEGYAPKMERDGTVTIPDEFRNYLLRLIGRLPGGRLDASNNMLKVLGNGSLLFSGGSLVPIAAEMLDALRVPKERIERFVIAPPPSRSEDERVTKKAVGHGHDCVGERPELV